MQPRQGRPTCCADWASWRVRMVDGMGHTSQPFGSSRQCWMCLLACHGDASPRQRSRLAGAAGVVHTSAWADVSRAGARHPAPGYIKKKCPRVVWWSFKTLLKDSKRKWRKDSVIARTTEWMHAFMIFMQVLHMYIHGANIVKMQEGHESGCCYKDSVHGQRSH